MQLNATLRRMCTNQLLPLRLIPNWSSQFCNSKLCSFSIIKKHASSSACISSATHARFMSHPDSCGSVWMRQQCFHSWRSKQSKSVWLKPAYYSTAITDSKSADPERNQEEPFQKFKKNVMTSSIRRDRRQNQSLIREIVTRKIDAPWTDDDWVSLAENVQLASKDLWEVACMHTLYTDKNISVARSLMSYLEAQEKPPSLIVLTLYTGLLGETSSGSEDQADETFRYYQLLMSKTDVLDAVSIEVLISGLSMTKYYHECVKLLRICQETSSANPSSLVKLLRAGLRNKDTDICHLAMTSLEENTEPTMFTAHVSKVVEECLAVDNQHGLDMVMDFVQKHRLLIPRQALEEITETFHRYQPDKWIANYGYIHHRIGCCVVCGHQMQKYGVSDEDFRSIQSAFLDQVIVGSNIFFKSSPEEVDMFVKYVKEWGPFDVVIDGLNTLYRYCHKPNQQQLKKVVEYFTSQEKKVLLLGSRMLSSYTNNIKTLKPRPCTYFTSTTKADDAFFLYAALHSGKNTLIVSGDKLRDHKFRLDPNLRTIFNQWLTSAQVCSWYINKSGEFRIGRRHIYITGPAKDEGGWHIPEMDIDAVNPFGKLSVLCLRNKTKPNVSSKVYTHENKSFSERRKQTVSVGHDVCQIKSSHVREKQRENLANFATKKTGTMGVSKIPDRKLKQSDNVKSVSDKEWFDN